MPRLYCTGEHLGRIEGLLSPSNVVDLGEFSENLNVVTTLGSIAILDVETQDINVIGYLSENFGKFIVSENVDKFICIARKEVDDIVICYKTQSNGLKAFSLRGLMEVVLPSQINGEVIKLVYLIHNGSVQPVVLSTLGQVFTLNGPLNIDDAIIDLKAGLEHYAVLTQRGELHIGGAYARGQMGEFFPKDNVFDLTHTHRIGGIWRITAFDCAAWSTMLVSGGDLKIIGFTHSDPELKQIKEIVKTRSTLIATGNHLLSVSDGNTVVIANLSYDSQTLFQLEFDNIKALFASLTDILILAD